MYRICICDDEENARIWLNKMLTEYSFSTNREFFIEKFETTQQLYAAADQFDIIFLDIDFPDEETGIEVGKKLRAAGVQSVIVFLTSYPQYALEGYEAEAFRYLLKPITTESITTVMNAVFAKWERAGGVVSVKIYGGTTLLECSKIRMVEADGRKQKVLYGTDIIETWEPLKELAAKLPPRSFAYVHQGCIVNLEYVKRIHGSDVTLADGTTVTLSRRQKKPFIQSMDNLFEHDK